MSRRQVLGIVAIIFPLLLERYDTIKFRSQINTTKLSMISPQNHPPPVIDLAGGHIHIFTVNFHKAITVFCDVTERLHVHYLRRMPPPSPADFILSHHNRCYSHSLVSNRSSLYTF